MNFYDLHAVAKHTPERLPGAGDQVRALAIRGQILNEILSMSNVVSLSRGYPDEEPGDTAWRVHLELSHEQVLDLLGLWAE